MSNKLANLRFLRIVGLAAGAAAVSGAAVLITASAAGYHLPFAKPSSPTAASTSSDQQAGKVSALCTDFVSHFSADLNTSSTAVNAAFQKAVGETLADQVKSGKLTQTEADAIKQRLAGKAPCSIAGKLGAPHGGLGASYMQTILSAAASALGITEQALKTDLSSGMSLSQIAAAQKPAVTEEQFRARLIAKLTPVLDAAVANKQITAEQEQAILKRLQTGTIPFWNTSIRAGTPGGTTTPASANI